MTNEEATDVLRPFLGMAMFGNETKEALRLAIAALSALERESKAEPVATMPPDEWVRDYAKKHCAVKTGDHWKADAWNLKCAFRTWAEASPPAPESE
jgi:hypothetical protein